MEADGCCIQSTNGKTVHADPPLDGFSGTMLDKKQVLAWLFGVRRDMSFTPAATTMELKLQIEGAQSAVNTFIKVINSGHFDTKNG